MAAKLHEGNSTRGHGVQLGPFVVGLFAFALLVFSSVKALQVILPILKGFFWKLMYWD